MTVQKSFKRLVRARMAKTGESYAAARRQVSQKRDRLKAASAKLAALSDLPSDDKVRAATGRDWNEWFSILDEWGAKERGHTETAAFVAGEYGVPGWWAQSITVWYQRARGLRLKHQQADGFTISASKTIAVPVERLFEAFVDPGLRERWLTDGTMSLRTAQPGRTARFNWEDGATRVNVSFAAKGPAKATVVVSHERLPDPDEAESAKAAWGRRLAELKAYLETGSRAT